MPCYERRTISAVVWEKANTTLLTKALEALEFRQIANRQAGLLTFTNRVTTVTYDGKRIAFESGYLDEEAHKALEKTIRKRYAREATNLAANRYGWNIKEQPNGDLVAVKRG